MFECWMQDENCQMGDLGISLGTESPTMIRSKVGIFKLPRRFDKMDFSSKPLKMDN